MATTEDKDEVKELLIDLGVNFQDKEKLDVIKNSLKAISQLEEDIKLLQESKLDGVEDEITKRQKALDVLKDTLKTQKEIEDEKKKGKFDVEKAKGAVGVAKAVGDKVGSAIKGVLDLSWNNLNDVLKSSIKEFEKVVDSSFLTNDTTRKNAFTYGMSAGQSYGFEQAKSMLGITSDESLMYMNQTQTQQFQRVMTKYTEKYNQLYDQGFFEKELEFQIARKEFELDVKLAISQILVDNKDLIIDALNGIITMVGWVSKISEGLHGSKVASVGDIVNNSNYSRNISVDNTFNIQGEVSNESINKVGQLNTTYWKNAIANL